MTDLLFRDDAYLVSVAAHYLGTHADGGLMFDRTCFYATSGGQPGDTGLLELPDGTQLPLLPASYAKDKTTIRHMIDETSSQTLSDLAPGSAVTLHIDWARRYKLMRMHTALHLLSAVLPFPVTGGSIGEEESRLDFDIPEAGLDKAEIETALNALIAVDHPVSSEWISDAALDAQPDLVKTMSVQPPRGQGRVRLVRIGDCDLQPCGGTHVAQTGEIGAIKIRKIEKKGRQNRRVRIQFA